jgi:AcrR family transcriptional regulator
MPLSTRRYRMTARADAAARTAQAIQAAAVALWRERPLDQITLEAMAERAGVSVRTVIRRFGSRDGVVGACIEADSAGIRRERDQVPVGDVRAALDTLLAHYERDGDAILRTLALEDSLDAARAVARAGRAAHRAWCARVFSRRLPPARGASREARLDAFVVATDLYVWKLLRRDLRRTLTETRDTMQLLIDGLAGRARRSNRALRLS